MAKKDEEVIEEPTLEDLEEEEAEEEAPSDTEEEKEEVETESLEARVEKEKNSRFVPRPCNPRRPSGASPSAARGTIPSPQPFDSPGHAYR